MSQAHKGSRLILKNQIAPVQFDTAHFNFQEDANGIQYGQILAPTGTPTYTLRDDGIFGNCIAIEEATTNLVSNGNFSNGLTGWSTGGTNTNPSTMTATTFDGKTCLYQDVGNWTDTNYKYYRISLPASTTYTISFLIYRLEGTITFDPNGPWNTGYSLTPEIGKWFRYSYTFTTDATGGTEDFNFYATASRAKYYLTDVQLEQKGFATSFVNGSRSIGQLYYPNIINKNTGTIAFWINPSNIIASGQGYRMPFRIANNIYEMSIYNTEVRIHGISASGTIAKDNWYFIVYTWDNGASVKQRIYLFDKDKLLGSGVSSSAPPDSSSYPNMFIGCGDTGGTYVVNARFSEYTISKYSMSDDEIRACHSSQAPFYNPYDTRVYAY